MRHCPVDDFTLAPETYEGVTLDRCPHCQGVWLDAGEFEAIQEKPRQRLQGCTKPGN